MPYKFLYNKVKILVTPIEHLQEYVVIIIFSGPI